MIRSAPVVSHSRSQLAPWITRARALVPAAIVTAALFVSGARANTYVPGRVMVKFKSDAIAGSQLRSLVHTKAAPRRGDLGIASIDALHRQIGPVAVQRAHIALRDRDLEARLGADRWFIVRVPESADILALVDVYAADPNVEAATPDWRVEYTVVPDDSLYASQWGHANTGQLLDYCWNCGGHPAGMPVGTPGFDARAEAAWDAPQGFGDSTIVIGIVDSGVDLDHPDLRLVPGYDAGDDDSNPDDDSAAPGHGTACAGVAAAIADNAIGVAGIAGGCSVMPLKVSAGDGSLSLSAVQNAIYHGADNGAHILSMSFGSAIPNDPPTDEAILYAHEQGVVMLAATGNNNRSFVAYPASNPYVIAVGAASPCGDRKRSSANPGDVGIGVETDPLDVTCDGERGWGSSFGFDAPGVFNAVDVLAPTILPTTDVTGTGGYDPGDYGMWFNGTSCATPYAAGVCGLILSANPGWTPAQVRSRLLTSCRDVLNKESTTGWDRWSGYGLVDAEAAVDPDTPTITVTSPDGGEDVTAETNVTITWTSIGNITDVAIEYSANGGGAWASVTTSTPNDGEFEWTLPDTNTSHARVRVLDAADAGDQDLSDANFTIAILTSCHDGDWDPAEFCGHDAYAVTGSTEMNHDCSVGWHDWGLFVKDFGDRAPGLSGDFDGDKDVDVFDLAPLSAHLGDTVTPCTQGGIGRDGCRGDLALSFDPNPATIVPTLSLTMPGVVVLNVVCSEWTDAQAVEYSIRITGDVNVWSFSTPPDVSGSSTACDDAMEGRYTRWIAKKTGFSTGPVLVDQIFMFVNSTNPVTIEFTPALETCQFGHRQRWSDSPFDRSFDFSRISNAAINATPPPSVSTCASGINVDLRNGAPAAAAGTGAAGAAGAVPADGVEFVYLGQHTPIWHYDGPFPNYAFVAGPDTTRVRWTGHPVPPGAVVHVGAAMQGHPQLLGILWLNGTDVVGCASVLDAPGTHTSGGQVNFSGLPLCSSPAIAGAKTLYASDLRVEWHVEEVPLADLLADVPRNSLRTDIVPGTWAVAPGESLDVSVPQPPEGARYMVLLYHVADVFPALDAFTRMFSQAPITWSAPTATDVGLPVAPPAQAGARLWFSRNPGPNPARGRLNFAVTLREVMDADVTVVDVAGRPVAKLHHGALGAGEHHFEWNGRTASGQRAPSGVYWIYMRSGETTLSRKFVLTR